ncbi:MAG: extracellular solute-binding protein [Clostridiales bacterium]|nr:extracellular solute-binding protein [Clostridiales bacterium]
MKKRKVKPFALSILVFTLLFLILFPPWFKDRSQRPPEDPFQVEKPKWTGVITLWDIPYVRAGRGSYLSWLSNYIDSFEKRFPGAFIDVRSISPERLAMYLHGDTGRDVLPDLISLGIYEQTIPENYLEDLSVYLSEEDKGSLRDLALQRIQSGDKLIGLPWMMGSYGLYIRQDAIQNAELDINLESLDYSDLNTIVTKATHQKKNGRRSIDYYGFCTYSGFHSKPLLGMIYQESVKIIDNAAYQQVQQWTAEELRITPENLIDMPYASAFRLFGPDKRSAVLLGDSKVLYDLRNLDEAGKGIEFQLFPLPMKDEPGYYIDQVAAYALIQQSDEDKKELCISFLKGLLEEEVQSSLSNIGMFSVIEELSLYSDDAQMKALEDSLNKAKSGPFGANYELVEYLWNNLKGEDYE